MILLVIATRNHAQCLSAVNPVGGTSNLLALEKNALRYIAFYKHGYGNQYFEGDKHSDFDLISSANYNYIGNIFGLGLTNKLTVESEVGYFINKTQEYDLEQTYSLRGYGFSDAVISMRYGFLTNHVKRLYFSASAGMRIPFSQRLQESDGVVLPLEVQPTWGSYGIVVQSFLVKENAEKGFRWFLTNRVESYVENKRDYRPGTAVFSSVYLSKHLMYSWIKGDWTTILQLRNEIRSKDKTEDHFRPSTGGVLFFIVPQINYVLKEKWSISVMVDIPVYQHFNGTQLGAGTGFVLSIARTFNLIKESGI